MPHIDFSVGTYINDAAFHLSQMANEHNDIYTTDFNGITMTAKPGGTLLEVLIDRSIASKQRAEEYSNSPEAMRAQQEAEDRKNAVQAAADELMQRFETLDYTNLAELVQFFDDLTGPSDYIGVSFDSQRIVTTFAQHGYYPNVNLGRKFKKHDREDHARYLIGQALSFLQQHGSIHGLYHKFAEDWRVKFATA